MGITHKLGQEGFYWFIGFVEDIADPLQLGRAKIRILNVHTDSVPVEDLDWSHVMLPTTSSCVEGSGETPALSVGSKVMGFFMDGKEKQIPMILGTFPVIPDNNDNKHSLSWLARGKNTIEKELIGPEPESPYSAEYPYNKTITSRGGHVIELDDTPENERVHIYHSSGSYIEINNKGRTVIKSAADGYEIVAKDKELYIEGDWNIEVKGKVNLKAEEVDIDCPEVKMSGDLRVKKSIYAEGEITGNTIKLSTHTHGGVDTGSGNTQQPN